MWRRFRWDPSFSSSSATIPYFWLTFRLFGSVWNQTPLSTPSFGWLFQNPLPQWCSPTSLTQTHLYATLLLVCINELSRISCYPHAQPTQNAATTTTRKDLFRWKKFMHTTCDTSLTSEQYASHLRAFIGCHQCFLVQPHNCNRLYFHFVGFTTFLISFVLIT